MQKKRLMEFLKKFYSLKANSILESVIALTIISICLCFSILIFSTVFTPKTSTKYYNTLNKLNELFFLSQLKQDSLTTRNEDENIQIEEEIINNNLKKINIQYNDNKKIQIVKSFYIETNE